MADAMLSQQVQQWGQRLDIISNNLVDLYGAESTKRIRAQAKDPQQGFSGITLERATRALRQLDDLIDQYAHLQQVIDEAKGLMAKVNQRRDTDDRVRALLNGPSVLVATQAVAINQRGLLDSGNPEIRATPATVIATMERTFALARDDLAAIAAAQDRITPRLAALNQKLQLLDDWAQKLGATRPPTLAGLAATVAQVTGDPLSGADNLAAQEAALSHWNQELQTLDSERQKLLPSLTQGRQAIAELRGLVTQAGAAYAEARAALADTTGLVPPATIEGVAALEAWHASLAQAVQAGRYGAAAVGLAKWQQACDTQLAEARTAATRIRQALDERDELRGRFSALVAKAEALLRRGQIRGANLQPLATATRTLLQTTPFDLSAARNSVAAFEAALAAAQV